MIQLIFNFQHVIFVFKKEKNEKKDEKENGNIHVRAQFNT